MGLIGTVSLIAAHPLNRGRRMAGIARYIGWQIGARLVPGPVAVEFVNGALLLARPGPTGAIGNVYVGLHEFNDMAFVLHLLRPGDLFVDAGANIGSYTVLAAAAVGARCMAFEPDPAAFGWLMKNVGLNGVGSRIEARCEALGSAAGTLAFTVGLDAVNHVVAGGAEAPVATTRTVPVTTLDAALAGRIPMMIKIDVEGYEPR